MTDSKITVTGLSARTAHTFEITAHNRAGASDAVTVTATPFSAPDAPVVATWVSPTGVYGGFVVVVEDESCCQPHERGEGGLVNPDDPDGDAVEAVAWWAPQQLVNNPAVGGLANTVLNAASVLLDTLAGTSYSEDFKASMASLSTAGAADFNARFPAGVPATACGQGAYAANGQRFYSMGGTSVVTNIFDPLDTFFGVTSLGMNEANDGLVGRCSNHFGQVLRDNYPWNHGDEVNHLFGIRGLFTPSPTSVYRDQANRLKNAGL